MKKHTPEQVIDKLRRVEALTAKGTALAQAVRADRGLRADLLQMEAPVRRDGPHGGQTTPRLEKENARLKKLLADQMLDNDMLKEVVRGKF